MFRYIFFYLALFCFLPVDSTGMEDKEGESNWFAECEARLLSGGLTQATKPYIGCEKDLLVVMDKSQAVAVVKHAYYKHDEKDGLKTVQDNIFREHFFYRIATFLGVGDCVVPNKIVKSQNPWSKEKYGQANHGWCLFEQFILLRDKSKNIPADLNLAIKALEEKQVNCGQSALNYLYEYADEQEKLKKKKVIDALDTLSLQKITLLYMICALTNCTLKNTLLCVSNNKIKPIIVNNGMSFGRTHKDGPFKHGQLVLGDYATKPIPNELITALKSRTTNQLKQFVIQLKNKFTFKWMLTEAQELQLYERYESLLANIDLLATVPLAKFMLEHWSEKEKFRREFSKGKFRKSIVGFNFNCMARIPISYTCAQYWKDCYIRAVGHHENIPNSTQCFKITLSFHNSD